MGIKQTLIEHGKWLKDNTAGCKADLRWAELQGANLQGVNLQQVDLRWADLRRADLRWAELQGANLREAYLQGANLQGANLQGGSLRWADLQGANLQGTNLQGVNLRWADLRGADLQGADLQGASLSNCIGNGREVISIQDSVYSVCYTKDVIQIGCERHSHEEWFNFSLEQIEKMDKGAAELWVVGKPILMAATKYKGGYL